MAEEAAAEENGSITTLDSRLSGLICGQVAEFIEDVLRPEKVDNDARVETLKTYPPMGIQGGGRLSISNDPSLATNLIDRMNTPFDHVDRILLQDFSNVLLGGEDGKEEDNWFKSQFKVNEGGISFTDGKLQIRGLEDGRTIPGEFSIDSFTYVPFIDNSSSDETAIGSYSDLFLNDYNSGVFLNPENQVDINRHPLSSTMFRMGNLDRDIYDAKISFRESIDRTNPYSETDAKVYIYTFCEHLASLFARLSNIRMCHEVYGLKHPHVEWEGILALDIWYQSLYRAIDGQYMFDEGKFNMNPMSRRRMQKIDGVDKVEWKDGEYLSRTQIEELGLEWIEDSSSSDHAYIWDPSLWSEYKSNSIGIREGRKDCTTPRGVLAKIYAIVNGGLDGKSTICNRDEGGDFSWFHQNGNVYSDASKSMFTRYANLHLGMAWERMSAREYCDLAGVEAENGVWKKPDFRGDFDLGGKSILVRMLEKGVDALSDAFSVALASHVFNVFNSSTNQIEEFNPNNSHSYSQGQCAIAIERVFSCIYKYLQFKSTTHETFARHVNIDSGYRYLTTQSILGTDNLSGRHAYYDDSVDGGQDGEDSTPDYLGYLDKVSQYLNSDILDENQRRILKQFVAMLSCKSFDWFESHWDLCPLLQNNDWIDSVPRGNLEVALDVVKASMRGRMLNPRAVDDESSDAVEELADDVGGDDGQEVPRQYRAVYIYFNVGNGLTWDGVLNENKDFTVFKDHAGKTMCVKYSTVESEDSFSMNLADVVEMMGKDHLPKYVYGSGADESIGYELIGFSTNPDSYQPEFQKNQKIIAFNFQEGRSTFVLHAIWKPSKMLVMYDSGEYQSQYVHPFDAIDFNGRYVLPSTQYGEYLGDELKLPRLTYLESPSGIWKNDIDALNSQVGDKVAFVGFDHWEWSVGNSRYSGRPGDTIQFNLDQHSIPVVTISAQWRVLYDRISFMVGSDEHSPETYCQVLVDRDDPILDIYPEPPELDESNRFLGWNVKLGTWLPGITRNEIVVCDDGEIQPDESSSSSSSLLCVCCDSSSSSILLCHDEVLDYDMQVVARYGYLPDEPMFKVTFNFKDENGAWVDEAVMVNENHHLPQFHIHQTIDVGADRQQVFRYWRLSSGNLSSSRTVLSDLVLDAVYDEIESVVEGGDQLVDSSIGILDIGVAQQDVDGLESCSHESSLLNREGCPYCTLSVQDPRKACLETLFEHCPYIHLLNSTRRVASGDGFSELSEIGVSDVSELVKALFKINIDIANNERFVKIDIPQESNWWYGYRLDKWHIVCGTAGTPVICEDGDIVCGDGKEKWISFEPTVEYKFSNFHAANQRVVGQELVCGFDDVKTSVKSIVPINRELWNDAGADHFNGLYYFHDYVKQLKRVVGRSQDKDMFNKDRCLFDRQKYYQIEKLQLHENLNVQSPTSTQGFVLRHRGAINRDSTRQISTFATIVKKYRPVVMPSVTDMFDICHSAPTKYDADQMNSYGVFGWCTIPSKTMVDMEYNEHAIVVPSSYDCHNRIGGSNFLQIDADLYGMIYKGYDDDEKKEIDLASESWYYLYNSRDWTYFMYPVFGKKRNNDIYSSIKDVFPETYWPSNSNHLNGVIYESIKLKRNLDSMFGDMVKTCQFLAKRHHNRSNLVLLSERYTNMVSYGNLVKLTQNGEDKGFNSMYGSEVKPVEGEIPDMFHFPEEDWVDDCDLTSSNVLQNTDGSFRYRYNIGQAHAIDDFDENSVWFYITMVEPIQRQDDVIEVKDIMPFVFWWDNRGVDNNGPTVDCYGRQSNAKLNYDGGYCHSSGYKINDEDESEQSWHAVQHTLGMDFSQESLGGTILTTDNSGNVYKGAFDPQCSGTDEKWKVSDKTNAFGVNQHQDPSEDRYYHGDKAHGDGEFKGMNVPTGMNADILDSIEGRPMAWNLWNVIRHYVYIKEFKGMGKSLGSDVAAWEELETRTRKIVKDIYRTFKAHQRQSGGGRRSTFTDVDGSISNYGGNCLVQWTNSFVEIHSVLERNAREHQASLVMFTGDMGKGANADDLRRNSHNFRITTMDGVDGNEDGMPDSISSNVVSYGELPSSYTIGGQTFQQRTMDMVVDFEKPLDLDQEYPFAEYLKNDQTQKWVRKITEATMNRQMFPVYTSMEMMEDKDVHQVTDEELKKITFQVVPNLYWKYEWPYNEFMVHRVGRLSSPSTDIVMYDMLGNVWEWVRDDWSESINVDESKSNPIVGTSQQSSTALKVIRGGAFDQLCRKVISSSREGLEPSRCNSSGGSHANVGFRPSFQYTTEKWQAGSGDDDQQVDLFFLFDASASQNANMGKMLEEAKKIVEGYAGKGEEGKDKCHVGTALFLGPTIQLMCSSRVMASENEPLTFSQTVWGYKKDTEYSSTTSGKAVNPSNCPYKNPTNTKTWKPSNINGTSYNSWICMNDGDNALSGTGADGKSYGLLKQFRDYKNDIWDSEQESGRSLDDAPAMMARGDSPSNPSSGGSSSQTVPSGSGGSNGTLTTLTFFKKVQKMNVFTGASVYKDVDSGELKFEDDVPLFTYDMSRDGLKDFKLPFIPNSDGRGALSNFFGGCEPICHTLDSLLKDGVFFDYPFNDCIGYLFRKNAKRVVFVFTDEFDNEYRRTYTYWKKETAVSSQTQGSVDIKTFTKKTVSSYEWQTVPAINSSRNVQFTTVKLSTKVAEPPDPYCVQQMAVDGFDVSIKRYLEDIVKPTNEYDVDGYMETMGIFGFTDDGNINFTRYPIYSDDSYSTPYKSNLALKNVLNSSTKVGSIILASWNFSLLAGGTLKNGLAQKILTDAQLKELEEPDKKFSYYELVDGRLHARYDQTQSIGFYELNCTVRDLSEPTCVYLMATDGSSSMRLYDPEECISYSQEHGVLLDSTQQDDMRLASIFVHNNMDLFNHIKGNKVTGLKSSDGIAVAAGNVKNTSTLVSIPQSCAAWWASRTPSSYPSVGSLAYTTKYSATVSGKTVQKDGGHPCSTIGRVQNILGLENPYTKNTMVFANRIENISFVSDANILKKYHFIVGLPCGYLHGRPTGWRVKCGNDPKKYFNWSGTGSWKNTFLGELCPSGTTLDFNRIKVICNHVYSSLNLSGISYSPLPSSDEQVAWIDWHMCPRHEKTWKDASRVDSSKMCMYNLDQDNIELFGISIVLNEANQSVTMGFAKDWQLLRLFSSKSYGMTTQYTTKYVYGQQIKESDLSGTGLTSTGWLQTYTTSSAVRALAGVSSNTHMIQSGIHDYATLDYKDANGNRTGGLKVVVFNDIPKALDNETVNITTSDKNKNKLVSNFVMDGWSIMLNNNDGRSIYSDLMERQPAWPYPASYQKLITNYCISMNVGDWKSNWIGDATYGEGSTQTTKKLYEWVGGFYDGMHALMPLLVSYRYHEHIFSQMVNHNGESCVEYGDGNDVWFKALPIIDIDTISQLVDIVPLTTSNGNLAYTHAIVDLNPSLDRYPGLTQGEFPISFANDIQIEGDEFKTTSIVFQKIDSISAGKSSTFTMGSRATDYDDVEDGPRKTYKSQDAIVDGAEDDYVEVTLGNGGSCQKNDSFYEIHQESGDEHTQYKYFKNRHFFIDPFELTIAQWCYVHGKNNEAQAREYLGNRLQEMERSYWEYLSVWEKEEWAELKENHVNDEVDSSTNDRQFVDWLVSKGMYNPLEDTRPYYYATYNDIRGTGQVYQPIQGSSGSNYVIDSSKGDEFQLNSRNETTSFMDILNHKVVCLTEERGYTIDQIDGGEVVSVLEPEVKKWCSGKSGGLNFDLPTEAQWEYCCRGGNPNAIPTGFNLGTNFEEQDRNLDLIAWYKYKEIGKLPEPERYCTWRIAKFAFGIDTDSELMNNVYEYSP